MNILPKKEAEFARTDYWDKFFTERGPRSFEWYCEYNELCRELHKYIKPKESILVVGCGNSRLSSDLYDVGYRDITNIDVSPVVIKQMKAQEGRCRPGMVFLEMDALNMSFEKCFSVVLDKGTLDALMPLDSEDDHIRAGKLFLEVDKVLKIGGRYIIISLLQPYILRRILSHFTESGWMIRVIRCTEVEKKNILQTKQLGMPVFLIICTKLKKIGSGSSILEVNVYINDNIQRIESKDGVLAMVDGIQKAIMMLKDAKDDVEFHFYRGGENKVRYSILIVDACKDLEKIKKYGAFIVPQGRENEWMFTTTEGRKYLLCESKCDRLAIIFLKRDQFYEDKNQIQKELTRTILEFAPIFLDDSETGIPFLTIDDDLGHRGTIYRTMSELSGEIIVEEVEICGERFRRLVFMNNQAVVQSEVRLIKGQKKNKWKINACHTSNSHVSYMSVAVGVIKEAKSVLVIGLGGGVLCQFLNRFYPYVNVTGVEIDPAVVKVAKEYFGLRESKSMKVVVADGVEVVRQKKYDVIMFDVDGKEQGSAMSSPPPQFLEESVLTSVKNSIGDIGVFVVNAVCRVEDVHQQLLTKLRKHFKLIAWCNMKEDVNRILFLSNMDLKFDHWRVQIIKSAEELNRLANEKIKNSVLDLNHFETELS